MTNRSGNRKKIAETTRNTYMPIRAARDRTLELRDETA
jgi:hypothetical protein